MFNFKPWLAGRNTGLTLVEILVILTILGLLAAISGTALTKYLPRADLKYASRTIVSLCQHARMEAIKRNASVALIFSDTDQSCTLYIDSGDGDWSTLADNVVSRRFALSEVKRGGVIFSSLPPNKNFVFNSRGRLNPPSRTIRLSSGSMGMEITVLTSGSVRTEWL